MIKVEMTDTYGGQTNYCWVVRSDDNKSASLKQAITRFKKDQNIKVRHRITCDSGDFRAVDLQGACVRIMAWYVY